MNVILVFPIKCIYTVLRVTKSAFNQDFEITRTCVSSKGFCIFNLLKQFNIIVYCSGIKKSHQESVDIHVIDIQYIYSLIFSFLVTPYYKNKLKGLYKTAMQDAELEAEYDVLYLIQEEIKLITIL